MPKQGVMDILVTILRPTTSGGLKTMSGGSITKIITNIVDDDEDDEGNDDEED